MNNDMNQQPATYSPSTHGLAITSLVLSILGLMPVLPVVGSIGGIVTGIIARKEIRTRPDLHTGEGFAKAGVILGWIGLAIGALAICALLLFMFPIRGTGVEYGPAMIETIVPVVP